MLRGEAGPPPAQKMPARIAEIVDVLHRAGGAGASELVSYILDWGGELRDEVAAAINAQLAGNKRLGRARPLSIYGDVPTTVQVWSPDAPNTPGAALDHTRAVMALHSEQERRLIELEYGPAGELLLARSEEVTLNGLSPADLARAKLGAENIRGRRLGQARASGKIGRNEACHAVADANTSSAVGRRLAVLP